jgi:hypothetical protein
MPRLSGVTGSVKSGARAPKKRNAATGRTARGRAERRRSPARAVPRPAPPAEAARARARARPRAGQVLPVLGDPVRRPNTPTTSRNRDRQPQRRLVPLALEARSPAPTTVAARRATAGQIATASRKRAAMGRDEAERERGRRTPRPARAWSGADRRVRRAPSVSRERPQASDHDTSSATAPRASAYLGGLRTAPTPGNARIKVRLKVTAGRAPRPRIDGLRRESPSAGRPHPPASTGAAAAPRRRGQHEPAQTTAPTPTQKNRPWPRTGPPPAESRAARTACRRSARGEATSADCRLQSAYFGITRVHPEHSSYRASPSSMLKRLTLLTVLLASLVASRTRPPRRREPVLAGSWSTTTGRTTASTAPIDPCEAMQ